MRVTWPGNSRPGISGTRITASTPGATPNASSCGTQSWMRSVPLLVHEGEQKRAAGGVRLHETADVDVTLGDDAVEGRYHALIGLLLVEDLQLGGLRLDISLRHSDRRCPRLQV